MVKRDISKVRGIVIHQTDCDLKPGDYLLSKFPDYDTAKHERAKRVKAHAVALKCGHFVAPYGVEWVEGSLDNFYVNLEIEGRYRENDSLDEKTLSASKDALDYLIRELEKKGNNVKNIFAHRQFNKQRAVDPGPWIWKNFVLSYAVERKGLHNDKNFRSGTGASIPDSWIDGNIPTHSKKLGTLLILILPFI